MAGKKTVLVSAALCEKVAGGHGLAMIVQGLREMKAWAADKDPGFKYQPRSLKFVFTSPEVADQFRALFGEAEPE